MPDPTEQLTRPATLPFTGRSSDSAFRLRAIEGADRGRVFELDGSLPPRVYVGQSPSCELRLADARVSRRHASFDLCGTHVVITDAGSRNGTYVNGVLVMQAKLSGGEILKVGDTTLAFELVDSIGATPSSSREQFGRMVGASIEMRRFFLVLERLAATRAPLLIEGEPGTGKDLAAEALHESGLDSGGPFVVVDGSASDVDAAVFGERGAYEQALGGTLVIDELSALPYAAQSSLAKVLRRPPPSAPRIIGLSRKDLDAEVQAGRFREDVLRALDHGRVEIPPLRRRDGDVRFLAAHLWAKLGGEAAQLPFDLLEQRVTYAWPGNVAELETTLAQRLAGEASAVSADVETPRHGMAPPLRADIVESTLALDLPLVSARERVVQDFERRYLERALTKHGGNVVRAAAASGVARRYFQILRAKRLR